MTLNSFSSLRLASVTLLGIFVLVPSNIQLKAVNAANAQDNGVVKSGSVFSAKLQKKLSSGKNKDMDTFTLKEQNPLFGGNRLLKNSIIEGHLEDVVKAQRGKKATLHVVFDDIILSNKQRVPLDATLVNTKLEKKTQGTLLRNAAIFAGGVVAGHIVGKRVGLPKGTGVAAATAFIFTSPGGEVVLNRGTEFKIKLNSDLVVPK